MARAQTAPMAIVRRKAQVRAARTTPCSSAQVGSSSRSLRSVVAFRNVVRDVGHGLLSMWREIQPPVTPWRPVPIGPPPVGVRPCPGCRTPPALVVRAIPSSSADGASPAWSRSASGWATAPSALAIVLFVVGLVVGFGGAVTARHRRLDRRRVHRARPRHRLRLRREGRRARGPRAGPRHPRDRPVRGRRRPRLSPALPAASRCGRQELL